MEVQRERDGETVRAAISAAFEAGKGTLDFGDALAALATIRDEHPGMSPEAMLWQMIDYGQVTFGPGRKTLSYNPAPPDSIGDFGG